MGQTFTRTDRFGDGDPGLEPSDRAGLLASRRPTDEHRPAAATQAVAQATTPALRMFAIGLTLRIVVLTGFARFVFPADYFGFGWEAGRIASSLASGRGFSDPFGAMAGPTAWLPPLYPFVLAGIFKLFGTYSVLSGWLTLVFNSVCTSLTAVFMYKAGAALFGERIGRRAGWVWTLLPYAMFWPTRIFWDTSLTACLLCLVLFLTVQVARTPTWKLSAAFGLAWGILALANPSPLSFAPVSWAWVCFEQRRRGHLSPRKILGAAVLTVLCVTPWLVRNEVTFGQFVFIRDNFGEELRLGNGPGAGGTWMGWLHPVQNLQERAKHREIGELAYVAEQRREALDFIVSNPGLFVANTVRRIYWFWCGTTKGEADDVLPVLRSLAYTEASLLSFAGLLLLMRRGRREAVLFAGLLLFFPAVYYVTFVVPRYRQPIDPEMMLLIVYLFSSLAGTRRLGWNSRAALDSPDTAA